VKYRALDSNGDMSWGNGLADFLVDSPQAVAQAILTRLKLFTAEWFLDLTEGTAWLPNVPITGLPGIIGMQPNDTTRDIILRSRILGTKGVLEIIDYQSHLDPIARHFSVFATVATIYGVTTVGLGLAPAPTGGWFILDQTPLDSAVPLKP
jgi:hypothetical protein